MFIAFAMAELSGSNITTRPLKSSLKLVDLHLGQTFSLVMKWQLVHAFSLIHISPIQAAFSFPSADFFSATGASFNHSSLPKNGCLAVTPIFPELPALPSETAVIRTRT